MASKSPYWFPAKRFGWGWGIPTAWQGWVVLILYVFAVMAAVRLIVPRRTLAFGLALIFLTAALIFVCYKKGEPPSWRWGHRE
jgi:hypothetical protein